MNRIYKRRFDESDYISIREPHINYSDELFESYLKSYRLTEKTFNISKDVDFIYKFAFKKHIDSFQNKGILPPTGKVYEIISSSKLKSKDCIEANKLNPVEILCGSFTVGSYVSFKTREEIIKISINREAIENISDKNMMDINTQRAIENEITEHRAKSTIYHELSHWVSNSKYNSYLSHLVARAESIPETDPDRNEKIRKIMGMGKLDVNMTHFEIDAQVHAIKQIKRTYKREWDNMTLVDLFYRYTALRSISKTLYKMSPDVYKTWVKDLVKRMHREGLLGKNMRTFPEYKMIENRVIERLMRV